MQIGNYSLILIFSFILNISYSLVLNDIVYDRSIICFGDSLTHGFYRSIDNMTLGNIEYYSYALSLRKYFSSNHTEILEYGKLIKFDIMTIKFIIYNLIILYNMHIYILYNTIKRKRW